MVVVTGQVRFGGGKEEGSGRIERRGGYRRGGRNAPKNDNRPGMRVGVQSSNLSY